MVNLPSHITVDVTKLRPRLRGDLVVTPQSFSGQPCYVIEDPITGKFSRLGSVEYTFVSSFDGETSIATAIATTASIHGVEAIDEDNAISLCRWLIENGLANTNASKAGSRAVDARNRKSSAALRSVANPMFQRLPIGNPTPLLRKLTPFGTMLFSRPAFLVVVFLSIFAFRCFLANFDAFMRSASSILSQDNWLHLAASFLGLKLLHELGHALACRRYGGQVREWGVMLILFAPLPYVDVTSSWRLTNKWQRIVISFAGMYVECILACMAMMTWGYSTDPLVQQTARNLIVSATVTTLLFNLNPLMRFDGYYMLIDAIEMPNLATNGSKWFASFRERMLVGSTARPAIEWPERRTAIVAGYGIAAAVWRVIVFVSLAIAAQHLFWGAGVVLSLIATIGWVSKPILNWAKSWDDPSRVRHSHVWRLMFASLVVITIMAWIPYHPKVTSPIVIDFAETREIRSPSRGFLNQVLARPGAWINEGQPIARLTNRSLHSDIQRMEIEVEQSVLRQRVYRKDKLTAACQVEFVNETSLRSRLDELRLMNENLTIRAPMSGWLVATDLDDKIGTFVTTGQRIADIADDRQLKLKSLVNQNDALRLSDQSSLEASVWIWGHGSLDDVVQFDRLDPRATTKLPHPAFGTANGGPLALRVRSESAAADDRHELVEPHVFAQATLPAGVSRLIREGQTGQITFRLRRQTLFRFAADSLTSWWCRLQDSNKPMGLL